ncbi:hypothetical protein B0A48_04994 [Cryoendolithus antarcticus]|uniref:SNF7 family protein n=1 Tax=Cryoendolithus antarcticus TaxID=1507870 RepID=A0A1V8TEE8_9PEZI|nr:hypothetical protein B0A48_04994 [Cryoendolithus antarcticus]
MSELLEFLRTHEEAFRSRARLASLYSDFRFQKRSNPDGYEANAFTWLRALSAAAKTGLIPAQNTTHDRFSIRTGEELARALTTPEHGRPLALGAVIEDAVAKRELIPLRTFLDAKMTIYAKSWVPSPWQVIQWGLRQLGAGSGDLGEDKLVAGNFVAVANVEAAAKAVLDEASKTVTSNMSRIFSRDLFQQTFAPPLGLSSISENDMAILLTHLARDRSALSYSPESATIKFASTSALPTPITDVDTNIASVRTLIASLETQIPHLQTQISTLTQTAKDAISSQQPLMAKSALRSRKLATAKLEQRIATLTQLEEVYDKIEQASDQVEMVRVMEASGQALRELNKQTGDVERVQDVMEGLREEMMDVDEIGRVVAEVGTEGIDEGEVDGELEEMERAEREKREAADKVERESKEQAEKVEREKREAYAAESTRLKLAELGQIGVGTAPAEHAAEKAAEPTT